MPSLGCFAPGLNFSDCRNDSRICAATANIAAHAFSDFFIRECYILGDRPQIVSDVTRLAVFGFLQQRHRRTYLPRSAVAALEAVVFDERRLHRMKIVAVSDPFDRRHLFPLAASGKCQTRKHAAPVNAHRTSAARSLLPSFFTVGPSKGSR